MIEAFDNFPFLRLHKTRFRRLEFPPSSGT